MVARRSSPTSTAGSRLVTLALRPAAAGTADLVPAGAIADAALVVVDDAVVLVPLAGRATAVDNLGCLPLADVNDVSGEVIASGPDAIEAFATAIDEWRVLTAAALYGIAARSLEIAVDYVKERQAFGRPLGAFQGVAHRLADRATEVDGAQLLAREAAWSQDAEPGRFSALAAMALGFAAETARDTTYFALHFHGGYGFMLEYPIQLYFRRARTLGRDPRKPGRTASAGSATSAWSRRTDGLSAGREERAASQGDAGVPRRGADSRDPRDLPSHRRQPPPGLRGGVA